MLTRQNAIRITRAGALLGVSLVALLGTPTFAQATSAVVNATPPAPADDNGGEIVVTAQKREEKLTNVPVSISVVGGSTLDKANVTSVTEVLSQVPGLVATVAGQPASPNLSIRGVAASGGYNSGSTPVGYYLDSVPFAFVRTAVVPDLDVYDLSRIEVLRGPQGTLYGAGSLNGVVRVLTNDANLHRIEAKGRVSYAGTEHGAGTVRLDSMINVPLIEDKLAVRGVVSYQKLGGWIDKPTQDNANGGESKTFRFKLDGQPTDRLSVGAGVWLSRQNGDAPSTSADNRTSPLRDVEGYASRFDTYSLKVANEFDPFTVTSNTSYLKFFNDGDVDQGPAGRTDLLKFQFRAKTFSEEVNLTSAPSDTWKYSVGGIYRDTKDSQFAQFYVADGTDSIASNRYPQLVAYHSKSWAVFGELTRYFFDKRVELTAGLRHFQDIVRMDEQSRIGNAQPAQFVNTRSKFKATTPRFILAWHANPSTNFYATYSEGFRSGFEQLPVVKAAAPDLPAANPDKLHNYEVGAKGRLFDRLLDYDVSFYYIDWKDVQLPIRVVVDRVGRVAVLNAVSASGKGVDASLALHPMRGLTLTAQGSINDLSVDQDVLSSGVVLFAKGDRLSGSGKYTAGTSLAYQTPIGSSGYRLNGNISANWTSPLTAVTLAGTQRVAVKSDLINVVRASIGVDAPAHWSARVFVENLTNEDGATLANTTSPIYNSHLRPRTIGIELSAKL